MRLSALILTAALLTGPAASQPTVGDPMVEAYREALAASPTPLSVVRAQQTYLADRARSPDEASWTDEQRLATLRRETQRDRNARAIVEAHEVRRGCVEIHLKGCSIRGSGYLHAEHGQGLTWQLQDGHTDEDGVGGGFVLLADAGSARIGPLRPLAWGFDGYRFEAPVLITRPGEPDYVVVPGIYGGSSGSSADIMFRWRPGERDEALTQIDNWSWLDTLNERLPPGLGVSKGVSINYQEMIAFTPLWRDGDGACCATGGTALLSFRVDGDRLVLTDVTVRDALEDTVASTPADILDYASRRHHCSHWEGEEATDAARRSQITTARTRLRCDSLAADLAGLRRVHAQAPGSLAMLERAATY